MTDRRPTEAREKAGKLERTLGLREALTIGLGTMVGAGIFVFPGLAVEQAGPAAALSFALGAGVALLVAAPTSELATAMPRSGGGYYFVSRALGTAAGTLVGWGQWVGLVFASAFYIAGFGHYVRDVAGQLGLPIALPAGVIGCLTALVLTLVAIVGTRASGRLQYWIVGVLGAILLGLLIRGAFQVAGFAGGAAPPEPFAPQGALPVFTGAAFVFTSYLGFAQIANVAGEVRRPSRNLPRAMIASVLLVGALYVATLLVATRVLGTEAMAGAGETALIEVGRKLLGGVGALVVGAGGLLATLSSANASILSSSRAAFALSRDEVIPGGVSRISRRFRTPHVALLMTGLPIAALSLGGRLEVLAEVASILHLVMYGLICLSVVALRRARSLWYRPTFRTPGAPWLPALGALCCFGLIGFMAPRSLLYAGAVVAAGAVWYFVFARDVRLAGVEELAPAPEVAHATLLLQVEVPEVPEPPEPLVRALSPESVVLLGWAEVPEQATPEQLQDDLGEESEEALEALADELRSLGLEVETELVFTGDLASTVERVGKDRRSDAVLSLRALQHLDSILLVLQGTERSRRAEGYAARIARAAGATVDLLVPAADEEGRDPDPRSRARAELEEIGVLPGRIRPRPERLPRKDPVDAVLEVAEQADLVVVGEGVGEAGDEDGFSPTGREIMRRISVPVLLVRETGTEG